MDLGILAIYAANHLPIVNGEPDCSWCCGRWSCSSWILGSGSGTQGKRTLLDRMKSIILNGPKAFLRCVGAPCPSLLSGETANSDFLGEPKLFILFFLCLGPFDFLPKTSTAKCRGHRGKQIAGKAAAEGLWMRKTGVQGNRFLEVKADPVSASPLTASEQERGSRPLQLLRVFLLKRSGTGRKEAQSGGGKTTSGVYSYKNGTKQ